MDNDLMTVGKLAERLKVPKSWIYSRSRLKGPDAIPRIKVGKYLRFEWDRVVEWLKKQNDISG